MEVLPIDDEVRTAILKGFIASKIRDIGISRGMTTLLQAAIARVKEGSTSLETALRVAGGGEE